MNGSIRNNTGESTGIRKAQHQQSRGGEEFVRLDVKKEVVALLSGTPLKLYRAAAILLAKTGGNIEKAFIQLKTAALDAYKKSPHMKKPIKENDLKTAIQSGVDTWPKELKMDTQTATLFSLVGKTDGRLIKGVLNEILLTAESSDSGTAAILNALDFVERHPTSPEGTYAIRKALVEMNPELPTWKAFTVGAWPMDHKATDSQTIDKIWKHIEVPGNWVTEARSEMNHMLMIRELRGRQMSKLLPLMSARSKEKLNIKENDPKSMQNLVLFSGGTYGSGKTSGLEIGEFTGLDALGADPIKATQISTGNPRGIQATSQQVHHLASQGAYEARRLFNEQNVPYVMDGSLKYLNDVESALKLGKKVFVKFSVIPIQQSLIRVLSRPVGGSDPRIPFEDVVKSYKLCMKSAAKLSKMEDKYPGQLAVEMLGPSEESGKVVYGTGKNIGLDPSEVKRRLTQYDQWTPGLQELKEMTVGALLREPYFSKEEIEFRKSIPHLKELMDTPIKEAMDTHALKQKK